jgi:hypothetical protein
MHILPHAGPCVDGTWQLQPHMPSRSLGLYKGRQQGGIVPICHARVGDRQQAAQADAHITGRGLRDHDRQLDMACELNWGGAEGI